MNSPVLNDCFTSFLHRAAQGHRRLADHRISAHSRKHGDLVLVANETLPALVIEQNDIVRLLLYVVGNDLRAPFAEGLDDFRSLGPGAALGHRSPATGSSAAVAADLPRLAVSDKDARLRIVFRPRRASGQ